MVKIIAYYPSFVDLGDEEPENLTFSNLDTILETLKLDECFRDRLFDDNGNLKQLYVYGTKRPDENIFSVSPEFEKCLFEKIDKHHYFGNVKLVGDNKKELLKILEILNVKVEKW